MKQWLGLALALISGASWGGVIHDSSLDWYTLKSPHFHVHYHDGLEASARQAIVIAEKVHEKLAPYMKWEPREPVDMVLTDEIDMANGFTIPYPANHIELWLTPFDDGLLDFSAWLESLITHEYLHLLHLDAVDGPPSALRRIFGRHMFSFPAAFQPTWVLEGMATYVETDKTRGVGRAQSSYFDMLMRMEVAHGVRSINWVNQPTVVWPSGTIAYLYGSEFMSFVADKYGDEKLREWITRYRNYLIPWRINHNARRVFGKPLAVLWDEFDVWLKARYQPQLDAIKKAGAVEGEQVSRDGYSTAWPRTLPDGTLYYVREDGHSKATLMRVAPGGRDGEALIEVASDARIDVHPQRGVVIAQFEFRNNARVQYDLYRYDPKTGDLDRLTKHGRYRFAAWTADGENLVAARHEAGQFRVDLLKSDGAFVRTLWQGTKGEIVSTLNVSPTQPKAVTTLWTKDEGWQLAEFSLTDGAWTVLTHDTATPLHPAYSTDGASILFSADYDGIYDVRRYDLRDQSITTLTRVHGGAFYPTVARDGTLHYLGYLPTGYDVFRVAVAAQTRGDVARTAGSSGRSFGWGDAKFDGAPTDYDPVNNGLPLYWSPFFGVANDYVLLGASTSGSDALRRHNYALSAAYEFAHQQGIGSVDYVYDGWYPLLSLHASRNVETEFNDDGDKLDQLRATYLARAAMTVPWMRRDYRWFAHFGAVGVREDDVYVRASAVGEPDKLDRVAGVALTFSSTEFYPLGISRSTGRVVNAVWESSNAFNSDYSGIAKIIDWNEYVGLFGEHVLRVRLAAGAGSDGIRPFELGGVATADEFLAEPMLGSSPPFNRREFMLRGYSDGLVQLSGTNMRLGSAEWRFPVARIERGWMGFPLGIDKIHGNVFVDTGAAWTDGGSPDKYYTGIGTEGTFEFVFGYWIPINLTLGFATGLDDDLGEEQVYLTVRGSL